MRDTSRATASLDDLGRWFSADRLRSYTGACMGDPGRTDAMYRWNAAAASAFLEELCHFEVILRNTLHRELTNWHRKRGMYGEWYDDPAKVLSDRCRDDIYAARIRLSARGGSETPGRVVAELNLGFWRYLLDQSHQQVLWAQALHRAFPFMRTRVRSEVQRRVNRLHALRNRIAHHERILHLDLAGLRRDLVEVIGWIDPAAAEWLTYSCHRLPWLLVHRPRPPQGS